MKIDKINQAQRTDIKNEGAKNSSKTLRNIPDKISPELKTEIMNLLSKFESSLQDLILKTWSASDLPVKKSDLLFILDFFDNNQISKENAPDILKAFTVLKKNNLPLIKNLIKGLSYNISENPTENNLSEKITQVTANENTNNNSNNMKFSSEDIAQLILNLDQAPEELSEKIKNYGDIINKLIERQGNENSTNAKEIINHLQGEKIINLLNNNLLLALEIPLLFNTNEEPHPLFLQVWSEKDKEKSSEKNKKKDYLISFILDLSERGLLRADIKIYNKSLNCSFYSTSKKTLNLIDEYFYILQKRLEKLGYIINNPALEFKDKSQEKEIFNKDILPEQETKKLDYKHIDFRI